MYVGERMVEGWREGEGGPITTGALLVSGTPEETQDARGTFFFVLFVFSYQGGFRRGQRRIRRGEGRPKGEDKKAEEEEVERDGDGGD
jgi:hypothetical protein